MEPVHVLWLGAGLLSVMIIAAIVVSLIRRRRSEPEYEHVAPCDELKGFQDEPVSDQKEQRARAVKRWTDVDL